MVSISIESFCASHQISFLHIISSADTVNGADLASIVSAAVAYRASLSSTSGSKQEAAPEISGKHTKSHLSGKRKVGKSKLRESWTPDVHRDDESAEKTSDGDALQFASSSASVLRSRLDSSRQKERRSSGHIPCPVCHAIPFHLRYQCPIIMAGPDSIKQRIEALKRDAPENGSVLIVELERLVKKSQVSKDCAGLKYKPALLSDTGNVDSDALAKSTRSSLSMDSPSPSLDFIMPAGSRFSEVTVESKDEGSTDESADDDGDFMGPPVMPSMSAVSLNDDRDLRAVIQGPMIPRSVLDTIPSGSVSDDDGDPNDVTLEEDDDVDEARRPRQVRRAMSSDAAEDDGSSGSDEDDSDSDSVALAPINSTDNIHDRRASFSQGSGTLHAASPVALQGNYPSVEDSSSQLRISTMARTDLASSKNESDAISPGTESEAETQVALPDVRGNEAAVSATNPLPEHDTETFLTFLSNDFGGHQEWSHDDSYYEKEATTLPSSQAVLTNSPDQLTCSPITDSQPRDIPTSIKQHQSLEDPIESADDLVEEPTKPSSVVADLSEPPVITKSTVVSRMKPRSSATPISPKAAADGPSALPASIPKRKPGRPRKSTTASTTDPPPDPDNATEPKRRGRPRKSEVLKAQEAAAKLAEKEERNRLRQEALAAKRAARKEEKARWQEEKRRLQTAPPTKTSSKLFQSIVDTPTVGSTPISHELCSSLQRELQSKGPLATSSPSSQDSTFMMDMLDSSAVEEMLSELPNTVTVPQGDHDTTVNMSIKNAPFIQPLDPMANGHSDPHLRHKEPKPFAASAEPEPDSSEDESTIKNPGHTLRTNRPIAYRTLSDITSKEVLFGSDMSSMSYPAEVESYKLGDAQVDDDDEDDDEDDDTESDSESERKLHIPKVRMAGSAIKAKKRRGLLSFA
jgi:hypothetical protein